MDNSIYNENIFLSIFEFTCSIGVSMHRILFISNNELFKSYVSETISGTNLSVQYVNTSTEALDILNKEKTDVVFCELEKTDKTLCKAIRTKNPKTRIHILIDENEQDAIFSAMTFGITDFHILPLDSADFRLSLKRLERVLQNRTTNTTKSSVTKSKKRSFHIGNDMSAIPSVVSSLLEETNKAFSSNEMILRLGLEELIINAIEHGNLNISFEEKSNAIADGRFSQLLDERMNDPRYKDKLVTITFNQKPEYDEWIIKDDGQGFNPCKIRKTTCNSHTERLNGRGLMLCHSLFDEIEFSENGTKVRLRMYVPL